MMQTKAVLWKGLSTFLACLLVPAFPVFAQQGSLWQGPRAQLPSSSASSPQTAAPSAEPQLRPPLGVQPKGEGHPQVKEMPPMQPPAALAPQPPTPPSLQPPAIAAPQVPPPPAQQPLVAIPPAPQLPPKPAYLGIVGETLLGCRYPAGVRVTHVIEGSPAEKAGLKGDGALSWKDIATGLLALTPAAILALPLVAAGGHRSNGDLILAVDGKRVHKREELEQEMEHMQPGDVVYFSVMRGEEMEQVAVRLTETPPPPPQTQEANATPSPGS